MKGVAHLLRDDSLVNRGLAGLLGQKPHRLAFSPQFFGGLTGLIGSLAGFLRGPTSLFGGLAKFLANLPALFRLLPASLRILPALLGRLAQFLRDLPVTLGRVAMVLGFLTLVLCSIRPGFARVQGQSALDLRRHGFCPLLQSRRRVIAAPSA